MTGSDAERERVVSRHGRTSTACVALGAHVSVWWPSQPAATAEELVAYAAIPGAMVAAGEPVAEQAQLVPVAERFVAHAKALGQRVCFFATEGRLATSPALQRRLLGEQPVWDPRRWHDHVAEHRSLREQIRRARAKGVRVHPLSASEMAEPAINEAIALLLERWRATRSMPPMHFLVSIDLTSGAALRRQFVAEQNGQIVALLSLAAVPARSGWLFEHLLRDPDAPNGTLELLVDHVMRQLAEEGVPWATLGLAPLHGPVHGSWRLLRKWSTPLFNFEGLAAFKRKLRPEHWEPMYLAWPVGSAGWRALVDGLRAFAGGPLWVFGARTVFRGPTPLLIALERLLVPWMLALALVPTATWFPTPVIHALWVLFDGALLLALRQVRARRERTPAGRRATAQLATVVAIAVSADALLTIAQAWWWNVPHLLANASPSTAAIPYAQWVALLVACAGPVLAAPVLWGAARRLRTLATVRPRVAQWTR